MKHMIIYFVFVRINTHNGEGWRTSLDIDYEALIGLDQLETIDISQNNIAGLAPSLFCAVGHNLTVNLAYNQVQRASIPNYLLSD